MTETHAGPIVLIQGLHFAHPGQPPLFAGWSAELPAGLIRLDGDVGSGKTTLLQLLAGARTGQGALRLLGRTWADDPATWQREVCWFDARDPLYDALTPAALMATLQQRHPALDEAAWQRHLAGFGLLPHAAKPMFALSTGTRRKAALAVALSAGCALTLLDEPAAGLDAPSIEHLAQSLADAASGQANPRAWLVTSSVELGTLPWAAAIQLRPGAQPTLERQA